jgi:L-aminopeptidase/D-esterase-like protein
LNELGIAAVRKASRDFKLGNVGAGMGGMAGDLKGGLGSASAVSDDSLKVGALVAVNCVGSAVIPGTNTLWAWPYEQAGEMGGQTPPVLDGDLPMAEILPGLPGENTTLGAVATNARLTKGQVKRIAMMAHDGYARTIRPIHTPFDGDSIFSLSLAEWGPDEVDPVLLARIGSLAADCMSRAIGRALWHAESLGRFISYRDKIGTSRSAEND